MPKKLVYRLTGIGKYPTFREMAIAVDLREEQKQELEDLASKRGDEDVSSLMQEAVDLFLRQTRDRAENVRSALAVLGTLDDTAAAELEASVRRLRSTWR